MFQKEDPKINRIHEKFSSPSKRQKKRQTLHQKFNLVRPSSSIRQLLKGLIFGSLVAIFLITALCLDESIQREEGLNYPFRVLKEKQHEANNNKGASIDTNIKVRWILTP